MRKCESGIREHAKHTRNAGRYGRRGVNKRIRKNAKQTLRKELA